MKSKKRLLIILVSALLIAGSAVAVTAVIRSRNKAPVKLFAFFHLYSSPVKEQLESFLVEFQNLYPEIDLEYRIAPYQDMRSLLLTTLEEQDALEEKIPRSGVVAALSGGDLDLPPPLALEPSPWISSAWGLFYNIDRLASLGFSRQELGELQAEGFEEFTGTLASRVDSDETVYSVGTAFYWPWLSWIQHLELLASGGVSPDGFDPSTWAPGISAFDSLLENGQVNQDYRARNFAGSQLAISDGSALFVLSDSSIYSTYPPDERKGLDFISFPGTFEQGWRIGSGFHLGAFTPEKVDRKAAAAEEQLLNYLHSESVADRFLRQTGTRILPRESVSAVTEIPSLTQMAREPELQDLLKYLK